MTPQPRARGVDALWNHPGAPAPFVVPERTLAGLNISNVDAEAEPATATGAIELGQELSEDDLKALRIFIREMVVQSILPWMERSVVVGNEQVRLCSSSLRCLTDSISSPVRSFEALDWRTPLQRRSQVLWRVQRELKSRIPRFGQRRPYRLQCGQRLVSLNVVGLRLAVLIFVAP